MKTIIGKLKLTPVKKRTLVYCYIPKKFKDLLGDEILFDMRTLTIRRPTLDSKNTISIENSCFHFFPEPYTTNEALKGLYNIVQKDEDTFKLKRVKDDK